MKTETLLTIVSILIAIFSVVISMLTFKNKLKQTQKDEGKNEGLIISNIGYIKACVERLEKTLTLIDEKYHSLEIRLTKLEEKKGKGE